jgi:D-glycero-alpha-D-manno-heptose-7-phosphate kinase
MVISRTPLRVSFAGGGTDIRSFYELEGGAVVTTAIDKYVYVIVKQRFDRRIYINYSKKEIVDSIDEIRHGLVREAMRKTGVLEGVEITTLADIPSEGSGLGSSSSITVGLLTALYAYRGETKTAETIAEEACEIEIDILGKPIGKQDQYIAAFGGLQFLRFGKNGRVGVEPLDLPLEVRFSLRQQLMLFYSNRAREADPILREQVKGTNNHRGTLRSIKQLAEDTRRALESCRLEEMGGFLHRGWELKKQLADCITSTDIDRMYESAINAGASGGKVCGAGGGGFLLVLCEPQRQTRVREALRGYPELPFSLEKYGTRIVLHIAR